MMKLSFLSTSVGLLFTMTMTMTTTAFVTTPTTPTTTKAIRPSWWTSSLYMSSSSSSSSSREMLADDDVDTDAVLASLKTLLEHLGDGTEGGRRLYAASSPSWRRAIQTAVGAPPDTAMDAALIGDALQQAMARPHSQFAILMGTDEDDVDFEAVFPTDPVVNDANSVWVECQLREKDGPELLVDMGISLIRDPTTGTTDGDDGGGGGSEWKIDELQWQDFRDAYYPGLSGREWLRAF